jgi:hypothetical protein
VSRAAPERHRAHALASRRRSSTAHALAPPVASVPLPETPLPCPLHSRPSHRRNPSFPPCRATLRHCPPTVPPIQRIATLASYCRSGGSLTHSSSRRFTGSSGSKPSFSILYLIACFLGFRISRYIVFICISYLFYHAASRCVVVLFVVVSQLGAKLASTDRGQASEVTVGS